MNMQPTLFCVINLFLQVVVAVGSNGSSVLLWQGKNIGNCLTNVDDYDDISSSRMSYPELEIAEPTGDMVICWKDV